MTTRTASLGMYDHPAQRDANDRLWTAIAHRLHAEGVTDVPDRLDRTHDVHATWRDPGLLLGQACGYPLVADPTLELRVLALPCYAVPGGGDATHYSMVVARIDDGRGSLKDFRGSRAAINDRQSNTGMNLFRATLAQIVGQGAFFANVIETGSHRGSVVAVGEGKADIAAIDCVTFAALSRFEPALTTPLRIVAQSPTSPTLPFVTAAATDRATVAILRRALDAVMADPALADVRATLFLSGVVAADDAVLATVRTLEANAVRAGYGKLC